MYLSLSSWLRAIHINDSMFALLSGHTCVLHPCVLRFLQGPKKKKNFKLGGKFIVPLKISSGCMTQSASKPSYITKSPSLVITTHLHTTLHTTNDSTSNVVPRLLHRLRQAVPLGLHVLLRYLQNLRHPSGACDTKPGGVHSVHFAPQDAGASVS